MTSEYRRSIHPASEEGLALSFAEAHHDTLKYVPSWRKWLVWDSNRWVIDEKLYSFNAVRKHCRKIHTQCNDWTLLAAKTTTAVQRLARSDPRIVATPSQWDRNPWLINTPESTFDPCLSG